MWHWSVLKIYENWAWRTFQWGWGLIYWLIYTSMSWSSFCKEGVLIVILQNDWIDSSLSWLWKCQSREDGQVSTQSVDCELVTKTIFQILQWCIFQYETSNPFLIETKLHGSYYPSVVQSFTIYIAKFGCGKLQRCHRQWGPVHLYVQSKLFRNIGR